MTDLAGRNLEFLRAHPRLRPFVEEGVLDFAQFDSERDEEVRLIESGESLRPEGVRNPLILVANYFFDSIPQDAFRIEGGRLYESLVTVSSDRKDSTPDDPDIISHLELSYQNEPADENYYDDPEWNRILDNCRRRLPSTSFLFPTAALSCVKKFYDLAGGRLLLLSADKGYSRDEALLQGLGAPGIALHGSSFSMMVDYHIIGDYVQNLDGRALHPTHEHESLSISAFMFGGPPDGYVETRQAYGEAVEAFGPDDLFTLTKGVESFFEALSPAQALSFLRLSCWDYRVLWGCMHVLKEAAPSAPESLKREIYEAVGRVWDAYLPIGEEADLAFHVGTLLLEMDLYGEALEFLQHSAELYGEEPGTAYNMAVCWHGLRQTSKALECVERALELDAGFDAAKTLRIKLRSSAAR